MRDLWSRAHGGDPLAAEEFRREFQAPLAFLVRRVLRSETGTPVLKQVVRAEIRQLSMTPADEGLVDQLVARICRRLFLRPGRVERALVETVIDAGSTLC